jgi:hypothetical protein
LLRLTPTTPLIDGQDPSGASLDDQPPSDELMDSGILMPGNLSTNGGDEESELSSQADDLYSKYHRNTKAQTRYYLGHPAFTNEDVTVEIFVECASIL